MGSYTSTKLTISREEKILIKYLGNLQHPGAQTLLAAQKKGQLVVLEISPIYYSAWDNSKHMGKTNMQI
jgi:hypothetical protein